MKVIETNGSDQNDDGLLAVCAACLEPFDERGGVLFDRSAARGMTGLCGDCANEVLELLATHPEGD